MQKYAKIIDSTTKKVDVGLDENPSNQVIATWQKWGFSLMDVVQDDKGDWYVSGHAPTTYFTNKKIAQAKKQAAYQHTTDSIVLEYMRKSIMGALSDEEKQSLCATITQLTQKIAQEA